LIKHQDFGEHRNFGQKILARKQFSHQKEIFASKIIQFLFQYFTKSSKKTQSPKTCFQPFPEERQILNKKFPLFSTKKFFFDKKIFFFRQKFPLFFDKTDEIYKSFSYLAKILDTHPWLTRNWRAMSHGRTPLCAISTIFCRTGSGSGRPFTYIPPSWLTPPCPE